MSQSHFQLVNLFWIQSEVDHRCVSNGYVDVLRDSFESLGMTLNVVGAGDQKTPVVTVVGRFDVVFSVADADACALDDFALVVFDEALYTSVGLARKK